MKADAKSLKLLGEYKMLSIPFFQRKYVWKEENWEELFSSLSNSDAYPFLGSIILKDISKNETSIIDGQQRLTTLTILTKALFDCLPSNKKVSGGIRMGIESYLFYRDNSSDDFKDCKVKISHSRTDIEEYNYILDST